MPKRKVFFSFHFDDDKMRVQQVRNMGLFEKNKMVTANRWEELEQSGDAAIKKWINENMENKSCLIVLVGKNTYKSKWVKYEIKRAWSQGLGIFGIYVHRLNCPNNGFSSKGKNPFDYFKVNGRLLSDIVPCYDPGINAYVKIYEKMEAWIEKSILARQHIM